MTKPVITRFAPSPTGYLHIGGARTALFNWLYAKANGGKMLLRIEDTDRARSTEEAVTALKDGLSWLGLNWDGEAISQFSRVERPREVANQMLANGTAYKCFSTPEELEAMRDKARAECRNASYDGTWRDKDSSEAPDGAPFVIRLRAPLDGDTLVEDKVQGSVKFPNKDLDDLVLLRSDGTPTYMLAVVVDDFDMGVTHIIRGDDHLVNAARQTLIFEANGWDVPVMAHIPLIHGADGAKLSKRHGAIGAEAYRAMGYLPQALRNYLVRLGWAHGNDEIMSLEQMVEWFGFDGMNKAAARFDFAKLNALNSHYIKDGDDADLLENIYSALSEFEGGEAFNTQLETHGRHGFEKAIPAMKERAKLMSDFISASRFVFDQRPLTFEEKAENALSDDARSVIKKIIPVLETVYPWSQDTISEAVKAFAEAQELKLGKVAPPMRAALTGRASSPGAFDVLYILGKEEALARLSDAAREL